MRLIAASIGPHDEVGLEIETEIGRPTIVLGPNNAGKSRLLEVVENLLESHRPEYRHVTSLDIDARRKAAQLAVERLGSTLCFELDQLAVPGSWDREFFAMHVGPYVLSESGEAAQIDPEAAMAMTLSMMDQEGDSDHIEQPVLSQFDPQTRGEYLQLLEATMRACGYVVAGPASDANGVLAHWPAMTSEGISEEMWNLAASLCSRIEDMWSDSFGPVYELPGFELMSLASRGQRPDRPFSPGLFPCTELYNTCAFPDFEILRFGSDSPSIPDLLNALAELILDHESVPRAREMGKPEQGGVFGIGDAVSALRYEKDVLVQWSEALSDLFASHTPIFARGSYEPRLQVRADFLSEREIILRVELASDLHTHVGSGLRNWYAYALARTAAELRRKRRLVAGKPYRGVSVERPVTTERPLLMLFDEPEAHLHQSMQRDVAEWITEESLQQNQTVIVATHSPAFLSINSPERTFLPLSEGRGQQVPKDAEALLELAGATGADLVATVRGFLFVEGKHEVQIYRACFEDELRDNNIHIVPGSGAYGAAGQCAFLSTFGKRVAVILDRVRPSIAQMPNEKPWPDPRSKEEEEVQKIFRMKIRRVRCIPFRPHDVVQAIPEGLIRQALKNMGLKPRTDTWTWNDIEGVYEKEYRRKPGGFKIAFFEHLGLLPETTPKMDARLDALVAKICVLLRDGAAVPPEIKVAFAEAMHYLEGEESKWDLPKR